MAFSARYAGSLKTASGFIELAALALSALSPYEGMGSNPVKIVDRDGNKNSLWDDAVEGSQTITDSIHKGAVAAGDPSFHRAMKQAADLENAGYPGLASARRLHGILEAATISTALEVVGQTVAAGPNAVLAFQHGGETIGTGAARIWTAEDWMDATLGGLEVLQGAGQAALGILPFLAAGKGAVKGAAPEPQLNMNKSIGGATEGMHLWQLREAGIPHEPGGMRTIKDASGKSAKAKPPKATRPEARKPDVVYHGVGEHTGEPVRSGLEIKASDTSSTSATAKKGLAKERAMVNQPGGAFWPDQNGNLVPWQVDPGRGVIKGPGVLQRPPPAGTIQ